MPFERVGKTSSLRFLEGIRLSTYFHKTASGIKLAFSKDVIEKLQWEDKDGLEFLWGNGEDIGKLKIVKMSGGMRLSRKTKHNPVGGLFTQRCPSKMIKEKHEGELIEYEIEGGSLLIVLPDWFYGKGKATPHE